MIPFYLESLIHVSRGTRDVKEKRKQLLPHENEERMADFRCYMSGARAVTEQLSLHEIMEAEGKVEDFMRVKFDSYIPLNHHNFKYELQNVMR